MKIETFTVSVACANKMGRGECAAAIRAAAENQGQGVYYVEIEAAEETPSSVGRVDVERGREVPSPPAKRRGRPPKAASAEPPPPAKRKDLRSAKSEEERGVPVTHRQREDGTRIETRGRCPGGATP